MSFLKARHGGTGAHGDTVMLVDFIGVESNARVPLAICDALGSHRSATMAIGDILAQTQLPSDASKALGKQQAMPGRQAVGKARQALVLAGHWLGNRQRLTGAGTGHCVLAWSSRQHIGA
ncbi:unnamed protein product [Ilex paraguariensis]|uniref:Uncharacterized protein n=1 Tax=Ilex paraguariensis TaxID=185542 RepID=A0ABC8SRJ8_9AQUA